MITVNTSNSLPGAEVKTIFSGRPSKILLFPTMLKALAPLLVAALAALYINWPVVFQRPSLLIVGMKEYGLFLQPILLIVIVVLIIVASIVLVSGILNWLATTYRITSDRIEYEEGIFSKRIVNVELWRIRDVHFHRNAIQSFLGLGVIDVIANDESLPQLAIGPIRNSRKVYDSLKQARLESGQMAGAQATGMVTP